MTGPLASNKTKAAELLLRAQVLQRPLFEQIVGLAAQRDERSEEVIIESDMMSEADLLKALSSIYRTHFVSTEKLSKADIPRATVQMIPRRVAETLGVFPVLFDRQKNVLSVVTADPDNAEVLRDIKLVSGASEVKAFVARPAAIMAAIRKHHGGDARAFDALERAGISYDFGQTVLPDGRVRTAKESVQLRSDSRPDAGESAPHLAAAQPVRTPKPTPAPQTGRGAPPPPVPRRPSSPDPEEEMAHQPVHQPDAADLLRPARRRTGRITGQTISAPPPPLEAPPAPAPAPAARPQTAPQPARSVPREEPMPGPRPARSRREEAPSFAPEEPSVSTAVADAARVKSKPPSTVPPSAAAISHNVLQSDTTIELLTVMVSLLENNRQELRGHSSQVARLLRRVAERMNLDRSETYAVIVAGLIHDVGKMGQFHLTALNCAEYEGHRVAAQKSFDTPLRLLESVRLGASTKNAVFHMYERFDGKGLPDKLVGKEIPLGARLLACADTYADLTQNPRNPFRKVLGPSEAMDVLDKHRATIFDPGTLDLFRALVLGEDMREKLLASRYRVLLVDGDPEESTVLELRMVEQGFDVKTARTVEIARKQLAAEGAEFDLVVCEVVLPDTDGLAFLSEARKESWGRDLTWVVHTQKQGRAEANRAFELGAADFVVKPVQADVLVAKLKAMIEQRAQSSGKTSKGVSGSLREMGLPDIVQVLFHGRKTGKLAVKSAGKAGEIHFLEGAIANALFEKLTGANAFYAMLKFVDGEFALDPSFTPPSRLINESSEALLLEGMRRMDEGL
ncbi:MAG: DUF4388 domain-containing protein [Deltaproteobacteria bacterium]|nr:DUF4388 domain-containing protein [Deltaproteobacteria bacterium]